ncbi:K(+)/H(+) antiporter [Chlamydia trachomatis]|nr:K(+)/H(+) antiporter [Chlamydia trachomatis]
MGDHRNRGKWYRQKELLYYIAILAAGAVVVGLLSQWPDSHATPSGTLSLGEAFGVFTNLLGEQVTSTFGLLLLQVIVILVFARFVAWIFTKMGQPSVIGEILAGIILGPSVVGWLWPEGFHFLFPEESLHNISLLSQFGLILFMFVIGMELNLEEIRKQLRPSFVIAHSGIIIPFVLGALLALLLYESYGGKEATVLTFSLFVGISLSVTAFPVLARIIQEQGKMQSHLGILSMASAANGDITAWCLLAVIMAIAQAGSALSALFTVLFAGLYMAIMLGVIRPFFGMIGATYQTKEVAGKGVIALVFTTLLISAYVTEILGLHALFGAFIAGVVMPDNLKFRHMLTEKIEDVSLSIFLPLFFVASGLSTEIGLLNSPMHWWITGLITLVAILGKIGGTYSACRVVGENRQDSLYMGILMNTRGLMELVILSMGLELGIISPVIYAMLVIMTLVTTFMTTPVINLTNKLWARRTSKVERQHFHILFSFARSKMGLTMLRIVESLFAQTEEKVELVGLHLTVGSDTSKSDAELYRAQNFAPIQSHADASGYAVEEYYEVTDDPLHSIAKATRVKGTDLLLVGAGLELSSNPEDRAMMERHLKFGRRFSRIFSQTVNFFNLHNLFKDHTEEFVRIPHCAIGVVIDRGLERRAQQIAVLSSGKAQGFEELVERLTPTSGATIRRYKVGEVTLEEIKAHYDLLLIPYELWQELREKEPRVSDRIPTTILLQANKK